MDYVYWIKNSSCVSIETDGYVGVSAYPFRRFKVHLKRNAKIPKDSQIEIIFSGERQACFELEEKLRPNKSIGWNNAVGGRQGFKKGFTHSDDVREKLKTSWTDERRKRASKLRTELNTVLLTGKKRPNHSLAMAGENNPMYGKTHSEESRKKIANASKGKTPSNKQQLHCIFCKKLAPMSILIKYHGIGRKNCKQGE